ncbi:MAG: PIG-L family deacetylase [Bacteroidetes bacterium]|nr:PIG-L family deacetylase [Bacteroidota bacterium]
MDNIKTVLVLAPHPDDGELGCGGTLKKLSEQGAVINYIAFSPCNKSLPEGYSDNAIYEELEKAVGHLGISNDKLVKHDYKVREFPLNRQDILEKLVKVNNELEPDLVFIPCSDDIHQDHATINMEGKRAFKSRKILGYELPWNNLVTSVNFFVSINESQLGAKINAIQEYTSQSFRNYSSPDFIKSLARVRGVQIKTEYAEGFEMIRWIEH